jgi:hypothetical protein
MGLAYILKSLLKMRSSILYIGSGLSSKGQNRRGQRFTTQQGKPGLGIQKGYNKQIVKLRLQMIPRRIRKCELLETTVHSAQILCK